jgi:alkylation response protein AidB-like acyl-CoA dehydrogenase
VSTTPDVRALAEQLVGAFDPRRVDQFEFRGAQFDHGLAWVHFPVGKGGLGISSRGQAVVTEVLREAGATYSDMVLNPMGIGMAAPTLLAYASEEVQLQHLRPIFTGQEIWCQMFSEPSSGSDVAGLATRGERRGGQWIVNGQKVWTSLAHLARFGLLLVRTDPYVAKHLGLTYFIVDMESPGLEVRPLFQITGEAEFNEVFLTDVVVPDSNRLGGEGDGWTVALTTLMNERQALGGTPREAGGGPIRELLDVWQARCNQLSMSGVAAATRERVTRLWIDAELLRITRLRARARAGAPGPEASILKLVTAEVRQRIYEACVDVAGADTMLYPEGYPMARREHEPLAHERSATWAFLRSRANTIEGGTSEILRNVLAERVLGLPGDVRVDKAVPWIDIPRS